MCSSGVQIIRYLSRSLLKMELCLLSCFSIESIVGVALICNTGGAWCSFCFVLRCISFLWFLCWTTFQTYCCWGFLCQLFYNFRCLSNDSIFNYVVHVCFADVWVASYLKDLRVISVIFNYLSSRKVGCYTVISEQVIPSDQVFFMLFVPEYATCVWTLSMHYFF